MTHFDYDKLAESHAMQMAHQWRSETPKGKAITVKLKKLCPAAKVPTKGTEDAACFDLYATKTVILESRGGRVKVPTGIAMEIPPGYCGRIYSRSSSFLKGLDVGSLVCDSDYRGEIFVMVGYDAGNAEVERGKAETYVVHEGDRIAQIKIEQLVPTAFDVVEELSETARGAGGYGSTGR